MKFKCLLNFDFSFDSTTCDVNDDHFMTSVSVRREAERQTNVCVCFCKCESGEGPEYLGSISIYCQVNSQMYVLSPRVESNSKSNGLIPVQFALVRSLGL